MTVSFGDGHRAVLPSVFWNQYYPHGASTDSNLWGIALGPVRTGHIQRPKLLLNQIFEPFMLYYLRYIP